MDYDRPIVMNPPLKVLSSTYEKLRNFGLYNHSDLTVEDYEWANLSAPQGYGPYDEDEIFEDIESRREHDLTIHDYPKND